MQLTDFDGTWCTTPRVTNYKIYNIFTCLKVCGISLMLNQNIINCSTPKGKHQAILIVHQWYTNTFWVYNQYRSNIYFYSGEGELVPVKTEKRRKVIEYLPEATCFSLKLFVLCTQKVTWYPSLVPSPRMLFLEERSISSRWPG